MDSRNLISNVINRGWAIPIGFNTLIIQWGGVPQAARAGTAFTFPRSFTAIPTLVMCETSSALNGNGYVHSRTITGAVISSYNGGEVPWIAIGY